MSERELFTPSDISLLDDHIDPELRTIGWRVVAVFADYYHPRFDHSVTVGQVERVGESFPNMVGHGKTWRDAILAACNRIKGEYYPDISKA